MQLMEVRRVSRRRRGWRLLLLVAVAALGVGAWLAYEPAKVRYRAWKRQQALQQAREFIAQNDVPKTQLALDVALNAGPADPDTLRVAAEMLEQVGAAQAMRFRRAVVRLLPESAADHAALIFSCLRFRDYNAARDALRSIPTRTAAEPAALRAALAFALATEDHAVADLALAQLRQAEPGNDSLAFTQALLRLKLPREDGRQAAEAEIERLVSRTPALRTPADRQLAAAAMLHRDYATARRRLERILSAPDATLADRLQLANLELLVDGQPFTEVFSRVAPRATGTAADAATLLNWLVVQGRLAEASAWAGTLPPAVRSADAVARAEAEVRARQRDWEGLREQLKRGAWGPIPDETLRLVAAAIAVDAPDKTALRKEVWDMALTKGGTSLGALTALLRIASAWGWTAEAERTAWTIGRHFPDQTWAFQELFNAYKQRKDTQGMREVLGRLRDGDAGVARYRHDWALLSLLTEPTLNWDGPKSELAALHASHPGDATYATGYAVALAQAERAAEALAVVDQLTPEERAFPPRLPYLAYVYGVGRRAAEFERAKAAMAAGGDYLPEEKLLVQRGQEALQRPVPKAAAPKPADPKT